MASISGQPQFRYTQPPSKVIHLRNLPWECTEEELVELGKPFGKIVNTKSNVGANRNQAFIEFAELNQAIAMISYYASSAEPAQVRGKTVYLQYSNRQEIVNSKATGDTASNVLLVTMEGVEPGAVSIDVLHLVFSAFGFVHKIATFEKAASPQALIQFSDSESASAAKTALDGRSIPSYLLPELNEACTLKINYSAHTVLNVKFQSHRSRDYTNPYLPVAASAIEGTGTDGKKQEPESNVLLASVENMQYVVTIDVLHKVFSAFGFVQKIAVFEKSSGFQALIQYPDIQTAVTAKEALEGHTIYEGGFCKLHLTFSRHTDLNVKINNERGRDYTGGNVPAPNSQPSILGPQPIPLPGALAPPYNSIPYTGATTSAVALGTAPILAAPGAPPAALPAQPSSQPYPQPAAVSHGVPPQHPSQGILELPPGVPPQFTSHGAPQFPPGTNPQFQMSQLPGQGGQPILQMQQMPGHANHQYHPVTPPQFMQYPGNGSQSVPNISGPQVMQFPGHGGQQPPPGPQMIQPSSYGSQPQPSPQFPVYGNQQFPPGSGQQVMPFPEQGGQQLPFAPLPHPYNK